MTFLQERRGASCSPLITFAVVAVILTTGVVAWIALAFLGLPIAAGVALGAIVAPPDAAAATAVLRNLYYTSKHGCRAQGGKSLQ